MRLRLAGGLDLVTGALIIGGAALLAASLVAAIAMLAPSPSAVSAPPAEPAPPIASRPAAALPADRVAAVLYVDAATGAAGAARSGDYVDVLGYFSHQVTSGESMTRLLLQAVPVLAVDRSAGTVGLTLAVPQESALLLQELQALGVHPFVTLRPIEPNGPATAGHSTFSDSDLAARLTGMG